MTQISIPTTSYSLQSYSSSQKAPESFCSKLVQKIKEIWKKICAFFCCNCKKETQQLNQTTTTSLSNTTSSRGTNPKPPGSQPGSTPQDPGSQGSQANQRHFFSHPFPEPVIKLMLGYLDFQSVVAFGNTSKAHNKYANDDMLWKNFINKPKVQGISRKQQFIKEKEAFAKIDVCVWKKGGKGDFKSYKIPYYEGITGPKAFTRFVSEATGIPLEKLGKSPFSKEVWNSLRIDVHADGTVSVSAYERYKMENTK